MPGSLASPISLKIKSSLESADKVHVKDFVSFGRVKSNCIPFISLELSIETGTVLVIALETFVFLMTILFLLTKDAVIKTESISDPPS